MNTIRKSCVAWVFLSLILALAACRTADEPVSQLTFPAPTNAPTLPTPTLAATTAPTAVLPTPSTEPSATVESLPTATVPAALTNTPAPTSTVAPSPTSMATVTALPTAAPTTAVEATPTATAAPTAAILSFTANATAVDPGDQLTLSWSTSGAAAVTLWRLLATGQFGTSWDVPLEGSFVYELNSFERNRTTFMLFATDASGAWVSATVSVDIRCTGDWFIPDPPDVCPFDPPLTSSAAEQHFERGVMIWIAAEDQVVVLFDDGNSPQYDVFQDEWDPGDPEMDDTLTPPPGLLQPIRGFGLVWREGYGDVRSRLGWAVEKEMAFDTIVQRTSYAKYNSTYLQARDGNIWFLKPERSGWQKLPGG